MLRQLHVLLNPLATSAVRAEEQIPLSLLVEHYNEKHASYEARTVLHRQQGKDFCFFKAVIKRASKSRSSFTILVLSLPFSCYFENRNTQGKM